MILSIASLALILNACSNSQEETTDERDAKIPIVETEVYPTVTTEVAKSWTEESVKDHIQNWKETPKGVALKLIDKYGVPDEITDQRLIWENKGEYIQTMVSNVEIEHNFPMPHKDCLKQTVRYDAPTGKYGDASQFDGSVTLERTRGIMSAECNWEEANILALNLANDVITGKKTIEAARKFYGETIVAFKKGGKPEYTQKLLFTPSMKSGFSDEPVIDKKVMKELMSKN